MPHVSLTIDNRNVTVPAGMSIWSAAKSIGVDVPVLCHHEKMTPVGVCRMCVVDTGGRVLAASCVRPCDEGMKVETASPKVEKHRRMLTALLLSDHPTPCVKEKTTGDDALDALGRKYGIADSSLFRTPHSALRTSDSSSPVIAVDHQACILCDRCIRACDEIQCNNVIGRTGKGYTTRIGFDLDNPMGESTCVSCGECVAACPTGALTNKTITLPMLPRNDTTNVDTVCPYCGVGCALTMHVDEKANKIVWAEGRDGGGNDGRLCVKGRYGWDYTSHEQRLTKPLIRRKEFYPKGSLSNEVKGNGKNAVVDYREVMPAFREASWDEALDLIASNLLRIKKEDGPRALAGFGSAKCSNEEAYLFQKLMRAGLGTNNVDHCTRLCHASSVAALLEGIGSGAVSDIFANAKHSDFLLLTGTNTTVNHPVAATFFKQAAKRGTKILVVDPRRPLMADFATWYCPINPDTDVAFYNTLMHVMIEDGLVDEKFIRDRTENFDALKSMVTQYPPSRVAPVCGIAEATLVEIARSMGRAKNMLIFWGMGISQHTHGTDNARCLIALAMLTGNIGRPGTGLHPLRGQNNVQGASDAGLIPMMYPDYQLVKVEENRKKFEAAWGVPLDATPGLTVVEIMKGALAGTVRGMYMMGENPFLSDPNTNKVRKSLANLEFLAVQDIFLTETAEFADVVLPASSFFEKEGTYTNTDRRVQIGRPALKPPGDARLDWQVICEIANRVGYPMSYTSPSEVFAEFASLSPSYHGLNYENLGLNGKIWPCPDPEHSIGELVLFHDRFPTPSGRGKFVPAEFSKADDLPDQEYPLVLNTGRVLEHWHTGTMTRRSQALDAISPGPFVEINPADLSALGVADDEVVTVRSKRGAIRLPARSSLRVQRGSVFIPFHFREAAANVLTNDALDPFGKIPEYKFCAVRVEKKCSSL
ncbi:MAG TPA: formate dehydrogenase subunit alpha [Gemmataceae bacterium]|jgi:formate dehydrogenase major subunit|nr:formate dehydrogenase subunit alpha [Gemmataceae bacterium]